MRFERAWWGFEIPGARPGSGTYDLYRAESLPPLPFPATPDFAFLGKVPAKGAVPALAELEAACAAQGLALPADVEAFFANRALGRAVPSCTACEWDLAPRPVPSPLAEGAFTVRLYRDQQDCLLWYLFFAPGEPPRVVCSPIPFDEVEEPAEVVSAHTVEVAPDFATFVARWWLENELWEALDRPTRPMDAGRTAYLEALRATPWPAMDEEDV